MQSLMAVIPCASPDSVRVALHLLAARHLHRLFQQPGCQAADTRTKAARLPGGRHTNKGSMVQGATLL